MAGGDRGCAKAVVETRGVPEPEWDGAYEPAERLVDPSGRLMYRVVSRATEDCGGDDETWSSKQDELWRIRSDSSIIFRKVFLLPFDVNYVHLSVASDLVIEGGRVLTDRWLLVRQVG